MRQRRVGSASPKKLLGPEQLAAAAEEVRAVAQTEGIEVALCGGYALQRFGSPRLTGDIDVVADAVPASLPVARRLSFGGVSVTLPGGAPADFIVRDDGYNKLYGAALNAATRVRDVPIRVVPPEYIAAMKMAAGRTRDIDDLEWIVLNDVVDLEDTRNIIEKYLGRYAALEFDLFIDETRWLAARGD